MATVHLWQNPYLVIQELASFPVFAFFYWTQKSDVASGGSMYIHFLNY